MQAVVLGITSPSLVSDLGVHDLEMLLIGDACCEQYFRSWELEASSVSFGAKHSADNSRMCIVKCQMGRVDDFFFNMLKKKTIM